MQIFKHRTSTESHFQNRGRSWALHQGLYTSKLLGGSPWQVPERGKREDGQFELNIYTIFVFMRQNMQRNTMRVRLTSGQRRIMTTCVSHPKCGTFFCFLSFSYEPSGARTQMYHSATLPLSAPLQTGFVVFLPKNTPPDVITNRKPCHTPTQCMWVTGIPVPHANRACLLTA